jgi:type I restriction enzyme, S subunit
MKRYEAYKPSGIEWLGKIPTHWEVERIKDFTYLKARIGWQGLRSDEFVDDSNWYCLTGTDFSDGRINWENCYCIDKDRYNQDKKIQLKIDDLLITKDGTIGKIALVNFLPKPTTLNSGVFVSRPRLRKYTNTFMYWILSSNGGCSIKCVKVREVIINNFEHGKERIEKKRESKTIE